MHLAHWLRTAFFLTVSSVDPVHFLRYECCVHLLEYMIIIVTSDQFDMDSMPIAPLLLRHVLASMGWCLVDVY